MKRSLANVRPQDLAIQTISVRGAREHNLKNISIDIPRDALVVLTGVSGSGKSTLAFDTIYAEGQRRYVESLSAYARQFLEQLQKPDVDAVEGLSPALSIEQQASSPNPRSTVGTVTEIYDFLRLLFARLGTPSCAHCGAEIEAQTVSRMIERLMTLPEGKMVTILSPIVRGRKGHYRKELTDLAAQGFTKVRIDGELFSLDEEAEIRLDRQKQHVIEVVVDHIRLKAGAENRLDEALRKALELSDGFALAESGDLQLTLSERLACSSCGESFVEMEPRLFSFNSPYGACPSCKGLSFERILSPARMIADDTRSILDGAIAAIEPRFEEAFREIFRALGSAYKVNLDVPYRDLPESFQTVLFQGTGEKAVLSSGRKGAKKPFDGLLGYWAKRYEKTEKESLRSFIEEFMEERPCKACSGRRLRPEALAVKIAGVSIADWSDWALEEASLRLEKLSWNPRQRILADPIQKEIRDRLKFLIDVGLGYLSLGRTTSTLSGGEYQRIRLASQLGAGMVGVLYVLDEPSIGLHPTDNRKLLDTLECLRDAGNTVLIVEHDQETIEAADYVIDLGPGAGVRGGEVVAAGTPKEVAATKESLTGRFLSGAEAIAVPSSRRSAKTWLEIEGANAHNLQSIDVKIPLGGLVCISGVSGSGKSSLVMDTLLPFLSSQGREAAHLVKRIRGSEQVRRIVCIDQKPIGRTPRSNPATYTGVFSLIRDLFADLPDAKIRGWKGGRFSFNVEGGRCSACEGAGLKRIEMHFLPDVFVPCEVCGGSRYGAETLEVKFHGFSIADVLSQSITESLALFTNIPNIRHRLQILDDVGLGYLSLGQSATTLSGGEAQRMKLARELAKRMGGETLYILDEPTTGLHFSDIRQLLGIFQRLIEQGNTVLVIEHNLDVLKSADYLIDLGPKGGAKGGQVVAVGTPEALCRVPTSLTGQALRKSMLTT